MQHFDFNLVSDIAIKLGKTFTHKSVTFVLIFG